MKKPSPIIPMSLPDITDAERQAVLGVLNTPILSMGEQILAFEDSFKRFSGCKNAIAVNSGTAGLHLCTIAAGVQPGDLVLTTPFSFVASTNVLLYENAVPVYVDVDAQSGNINPEKLAEAAEDLMKGGKAAQRRLPRQGWDEKGKLKAILAVDVFGQPADWDPIRQVADRYHLKLIDDSCEALGSEYKGKKAGSLGDYGVFAFYPNKQITTGEGGIIVTDDDKAADLMRSLRNQGRYVGDTWLQHTYLGYNYRMTEMSAALGVVQMGRLDELMHNRQQVANWYSKYLKTVEGIEAPYLAPTTTLPSWFVYVIRLAHGISRQEIAEKLSQRGIPVRPYFLPLHIQPFIQQRFGYQLGDFPITEDLGERGLALPFSGKMSEEQVKLVCKAVEESIE